jgi:hypothetical protein
MFRAILRTQWGATRGLVLLAAILGFGVPLASFQAASGAETPHVFVQRMQEWGTAYAVLAAIAGLLVGMAAWRQDQQGRHVYALSLPISRARYTLFRFAAGAIFLAPVVGAVLVGASVVSLTGAIPTGLHAYPIALTVRFALAAALAYAMFFAISSATQKTAGIIIGVLVGAVFAQYLINVVGTSEFDLLGLLADIVFTRPGLLSVFAGRWMLIDV